MDGTQNSQMRSRRAFTLIELLMVVSIIALLIAILLPALGQAQQTSKRAGCQANLRGMGTALHVFLAANDNMVPWNGIVLPKPGSNGHGEPNQDRWDLPDGALWDYLNKNPKAYMCREDTRLRNGYGSQMPLQRDPNAKWVKDDGTPMSGAISVSPGPNGYWSYSVNSVLNSEGRFREYFFPRGPTANTHQPWIDPIKFSNIAKWADFFVFIEEDENSPFNDEVFDAPAYNGGDKLTNRHKNGGNVGFADGHVEWFSDVIFNNGIAPGSGPSADHWAALQYPITRNFFPDGGNFATPP